MTNCAPIPKRDENGNSLWWANGKLHRADGPAMEYADGSKLWYVNGKLDRTDGPAVEWDTGNKQWYVKGERHRVEGPAIENTDGSNEWWVNGEVHRTDGPAVEYADGSKEWWIHGEEILPPYTYLLAAVFARGLAIPPEVLPEMLKAMSEVQGSQNDQLNELNSILHKYWPTDVQNILATLFSDSDLVIKHLAFSLLAKRSGQPLR